MSTVLDPAPGVLASSEVTAWHHALATSGLPVPRSAQADAQRVDLLTSLEQLKNAICAVQADLAVGLDASQRAQQAQAGVPVARRGLGVASQVGLARQESPHRGGVLLGLGKALVAELPHTRAALRAGLISEYAALLVARESACLDPVDRAEVDEVLCADPEALHGVGPRGLAAQARSRSAVLDPASVVRRARRAETQRCLTLRPAPDTMAYLTALVPVAQGVAAYAAMSRGAEALRGAGDLRSRGQLMADLLVERLTGQEEADAVPVSVDLVISDASLFGAGHEPAVLGAVAVPAQVARELVARALETPTDTWLRRLYAAPDGELVAISSRQRFVRGGLAAFLRVRDQGLCRVAWCEAPARHADHLLDTARGGDSTGANTQSLCQGCNHAKQAPGWSHRARPGPGVHAVEVTTPTGHRHTSTPPQVPRPATPARSRVDQALDQILERLADSGTRGRC
ncbi:MAG: 13E12 repeat family protein [Nocardioides sp.]|nr:13E12 repeat family protein [Nocardioides sp.]